MLICRDIYADGAAPLGVVPPSRRVVMVLSGLVRLRGLSLGESLLRCCSGVGWCRRSRVAFPLWKSSWRLVSLRVFPRVDMQSWSQVILLVPTAQCVNGCAYVCFSLRQRSRSCAWRGPRDNDDSIRAVSADGALGRSRWTRSLRGL